SQRLDGEVLDSCIDEFLVISDSLLLSTGEGKAAPGTGEALFLAFGKVAFKFRVKACLVLGQDEPTREMRPQHAVKGASERVAMLVEYRELAAYTIRCRFATDHVKRSH